MPDPSPPPHPDHDAWNLETRSDLPNGFAPLLATLPRIEWPGHPRFNGMARFWIDRHDMFRRLPALMIETLDAAAERDIDARTTAHRIARLGSTFINELHGHHGIEDSHYFPLLRTREPSIGRAIDLLDRDHVVLDARLRTLVEETEALLAALAPDRVDRADRADGPASSQVPAYRESLASFVGPLTRHLEDEEDIVVPALLKHADM